MSSIIYQDESDESDNRIIEEDESSMEQDGITASNLNYSAEALIPYERITTPPQEFSVPAEDCRHQLLAQPLTFDKNFFDAIPYIDQTDDVNITGTSEYIQEKSNNHNVKDSQKHVDIEYDSQQTLNVVKSTFVLETCRNSDSSPIDIHSLPKSKSMLSVKDLKIEMDPIPESNLFDSSHFQSTDDTKRTINVDKQYEDQSDDVSNSEDCADVSSSTINDDCPPGMVDRDSEKRIATPKMYTIMPELHLDLSGLNSDVSSDESKTEKCWKSPEEVRLGCGRVATLAKHFSKLGDAGLIRFKSTKLTDSRQFVSEPDITTSEEDGQRLRRVSRAKEYKSDSDLMKEMDDPQIGFAAKHIILVDFETNGDFAIEKCQLHHCDAKRIAVARIPSSNDDKDNEKVGTDTLTETENLNALSINSKNRIPPVTKRDVTDIEIEKHNIETDSSKFEVLADVECYKNALFEDVSLKRSSSKLSLEEQQVIVEQLEQFSNLDNTNAPLFIPERSAEQNPLTSSNNENSETVVSGNSASSYLRNQSQTMFREKLLSMTDTDDSFRRTKLDETSGFSSPSSLPSIRSLSPSGSSVVLSLSNVAKSSLSLEDNSSQAQQSRIGTRSKSCLFINISHSSAKNCYDISSKSQSMLPLPVNAYTQPRDKLDILRVRIARPFCGSENNLVDAAICRKEEVEQAVDGCSRSATLTRSYESILDNKFTTDYADQTLPTKSPCKNIDLIRNSYEELNPEFKGKTQWHRHRSLEDLESKKKSRNILTIPTSNRTAEIQGSDWILKKLCKKRMNCEQLKGSVLGLSREDATNKEREKQHTKWRSQSDLDISKRQSDLKRDGWSFREISLLKNDNRSALCKLHNMCYALNVRFNRSFLFSLRTALNETDGKSAFAGGSMSHILDPFIFYFYCVLSYLFAMQP